MQNHFNWLLTKQTKVKLCGSIKDSIVHYYIENGSLLDAHQQCLLYIKWTCHIQWTFTRHPINLGIVQI